MPADAAVRTPDLLEQLNVLNPQLSFVRVLWRDGAVLAAHELLARTIDDHDASHARDTVADTADFYDVRLQEAFGGEVSFPAGE